MKKIPCGNPTCNQRRINWDNPDVMRPHREVEVTDDYMGKSFCSITCACESGYFHVMKGWLKDPAKD